MLGSNAIGGFSALAILGDEIWLEWTGGVNSALAPNHIGEDQIAACFNCITRDGTIRIDQRYILKAEYQTGNMTPTGSGYGKYGSGDQSEQYVAVLDRKMFLVDLTESVLSFQPVNNAQNLAAGDWVFEQFQSWIYGGNVTAGIGRKKLFPGNDGTGDWTLIQKPIAPTVTNTNDKVEPYTTSLSFAGASSATTGGGISVTLSDTSVGITTTSAGEKTVTITLASAQDFSYRDVSGWSIYRTSPSTMPVPDIQLIEGTATDGIQLIPWPYNDGTGLFLYRHQNIARSNRDAVTKVKFTFTAPAGTNYYSISCTWIGRVWLSVPSSHNPGANPPTLQVLQYAYTYYNSSTGLESAPLDGNPINVGNQLYQGEWRTIGVTASAQSGVNKIRIYRVVGAGTSSKTYYRLTEIANATTTFVDKLSLDEVEVLPTYTPTIVPASGITAMCAYLGRLAIGVGPLLYISRDDDELGFETLEGAADEFDEGRGLTIYADDRQAEDIVSLVAGDALYVITNRSVRCLFGTGPSNWRYVKLPNTEGAVGPRAACGFGNGVLVLTPSGRLLYCELGQLQPVEVSASLRARIGSLGMKAYASESAVVSVEPNGEIHVRNGAAYAIMDVERRWRQGEHRDGTHSLLFVPGLPVRWIGTNGKLYEGGDDSYVTDGGTLGDNGQEPVGYVESREYNLPRAKARNLYLGASTESLGPGDVLEYPKFDIITARGTRMVKKLKGKSTVPLSISDSGERFQVRIHIDRHSIVTECRIRLDGLSEAAHR